MEKTNEKGWIAMEEKLFTVFCKNCGAPAGYDIVSQRYRCPHCGEVSGIREVRKALGFKKLDPADREEIVSRRQACVCPGCGAEVLYEAGEESKVCTFCGSRLIRREFEESGQFPQYIIPFVLTKEEAAQRLRTWGSSQEAKLAAENADAIEGWYLPYTLIRGGVEGTVRREFVQRDFHVKGFVENALVSTSKQLDNPVLDAAEPFDLGALVPFEHGFIGGHKVKLADAAGADRQRETLREAERDLKPRMVKTFHTDGLDIFLDQGDFLEIPVLLPMYLVKKGDFLAVVNGQTGRVAATAGKEKNRAGLWKLEAWALAALLVLFFTLVTGRWILGLVAAVPFLASIPILYSQFRYSVVDRLIRKGKQTAASREDEQLRIHEDDTISKNPFPVDPVFREKVGREVLDVKYRFYPPLRVISLIVKTLVLFFLPTIIGAVLHFGLGMGDGFRLLGGLPWFWVFGIFCVVYFYRGGRQMAYERPFVYRLSDGALVGAAKKRRLPFLDCLLQGLTPAEYCKKVGQPEKNLMIVMAGCVVMLIVSIFGTI